MTRIFVFGSNLAGRHGKGAAKYAVEHHGAVYGKGEGLQGNSYAIPTKDVRLASMPLSDIQAGYHKFRAFAASRPDLTFELTPFGCGLAGFHPKIIAGIILRIGTPPNVVLSPSWLDYI